MVCTGLLYTMTGTSETNMSSAIDRDWSSDPVSIRDEQLDYCLPPKSALTTGGCGQHHRKGVR